MGYVSWFLCMSWTYSPSVTGLAGRAAGEGVIDGSEELKGLIELSGLLCAYSSHVPFALDKNIPTHIIMF